MQPQILSGAIIENDEKPITVGSIHTQHNGVQIGFCCGEKRCCIACSGDDTYEHDPSEFVLRCCFFAAGLEIEKLDIKSVNNRWVSVRERGDKSHSEIHLSFDGEEFCAVSGGPNTFRATTLSSLKIVNEIQAAVPV